MTKTYRFLLAAGVSLALAFTFSCSSDGDDNGGGSGQSGSQTTAGLTSSLPEAVQNQLKTGVQGYRVTGYTIDNDPILERYTGTVDLSLLGQPAGKIENGLLKLDLHLPTNIDPEMATFYERFSYCQGASVNPRDVKGDDYGPREDSEYGCRLRFNMITAKGKCEGKIWYSSGSVNITGTGTCTDKGIEFWTEKYSLSFSKGWNLACEYEDENGIEHKTTDLSNVTGLEYMLDCYW